MSQESTKRLGGVTSVDLTLHRMSPRTLRKRLFPIPKTIDTETRCTRSEDSCPLRKTRGTGRLTKGTVKNRKSKALSAKLLKMSENRQSEHSSGNLHSSPLPPTDNDHCTTTTTPTNTTDVIMETDSTSDDLIVMSPKTPQQKEKTQLARQRQLEDMKAREAAFAREERLLKRRGLWTAPVKKQTGKKITWKADIAIVFNYQQV